MSNDNQAVARTFPQSVHDSLAELRAIAKRAKSRDDPELRRATEDEIALALTLHKPWMCSGKSSRTGLPCTAKRILGATVCLRHGGSLKRTRMAAANRLREATMPVLNGLIETALQKDNLVASVKAADSVLDRAGIGEVVQAKVRSSKHQAGGNKVIVQIGFLSREGDSPLTLEVPAAGKTEA